jgi:hypothetical protein
MIVEKHFFSPIQKNNVNTYGWPIKKNKKYASSLNELKVPENDIQIDGKKNTLNLESNSRQFLISIKEDGSNNVISLDQDGLISN